MATSQASLNELLKWGVENSKPSDNSTTTRSQTSARDSSAGLNAAALAELLGGPSDADRMRGAMTAILAPTSEVDLENKLIAWDNLEQLIEQIDNANNMFSLGLWTPLIQQLDSEEAQMRRMSAWCISTAVQNNVKCQETLLGTGAIAKIVKVATDDGESTVRKKAISALSSEVRNFQPGLDEVLRCIPESVWRGGRRLDAGDMEAVDGVIQALRDHAARS